MLLAKIGRLIGALAEPNAFEQRLIKMQRLSALVGLALFVAACGSSGGTGTATESLPPGTLGPLTVNRVVEGVGFYPACGNEILDFEGTLLYPITTSDFDIGAYQDPDVTLGSDEPTVGGLVRVAEPGPGDDVGTLLLYGDGTAYFKSDSGDIWTWLTDVERTYEWVC